MMERLSAEYGWTPKQIKQQTTQDIIDYWKILSYKKWLQEKEREKQNRKIKRK